MLKKFEDFGEYIKLNVGGSLFQTSVATVRRAPEDSVIAALFSGRMKLKTDSEGWILIDRSGKHFSTILNYLRDGQVPFSNNTNDLNELLIETRFYCLESFCKSIEAHIENIHCEKENESLTKIYITKSGSLAKTIIDSTLKPVVMLTMSKRNNILAYTSNTQDNLLKNNECFEKYTVIFSGVIIFIKNISEDLERYHWSFYYQGQEIGFFDCKDHLNIEKGLLKVKFNESQIYQEILLLISKASKGTDKDELSEIPKNKNMLEDKFLNNTSVEIVLDQAESDIEISRELRYEMILLFDRICEELLLHYSTIISHHIVTRRFRPKSFRNNGRPSFKVVTFPEFNYSGFVALNNAFK